MKSILFLLFLIITVALFAQEPVHQYTDGSDLTVLGRSENIDAGNYHRIATEDLTELPKRVRELSENSAGLHLNFRTDSESISVKWELDQYRDQWNMTPIAVNGLDLYGYVEGKWQFVSSARPSAEKNEATLIKNLDGKMRHYRIYLPLYSSLKSIQVGVDQGAAISKADLSVLPEEKVVIYGSSITQGASASRPGLAFPSILSRNLNLDVLNFGFSGSGKIETEVAHVLGKIETELFILDCVPNPSAEQISERTIPFVNHLRKVQPGTPILMVESVFRENAHWDLKLKGKVTAQNKAFKEAYEQLIKNGNKDIFYITSKELIGTDHEATIDGTHFNDIGHLRISRILSDDVKKILGLPEPEQ